MRAAYSITNDVFFRWLFGSDDNSTNKIIEDIIEEITGHRPHELIIKNPVLLPEQIELKRSQADILGLDKLGNFYNLEMETGWIEVEDKYRFLNYNTKNYTYSVKIGKPYSSRRKSGVYNGTV